MRDVQRLFSGCLLLADFIGHRSPAPALSAPAPDQFRAAIARGQLRGTPELRYVRGTMDLVAFTAAHPD